MREISFFVASEAFADLSVLTEDLLLSAALSGTSSMFVPLWISACPCMCVWDCLGWDHV